MSGLTESHYLKFPFSVGKEGPKISTRSEHVREQIEQVLFTSPKERVFRPEFGVGVRRLVFEPNNTALRNTTVKRLNASLAEALHGEVDPHTLEIEVRSEDAKLNIQISYVLAAINKKESYMFVAGSSGENSG
ncbi:MAG: GPW/gp25 family protein [Gammaproteobacteria bacterium]|nr:GPW/gp25 family protein [Gammaproteobacteria bacterium]